MPAMVCKLRLSATALALLLSAGLTSQSQAQSPQIAISYEEPTSAELRPIYDQLRQQGVLQTLQLFMEPLRLPSPIDVKTAQCGANPLPYTPGGPVTVCYEVLDQVAKLAKQHSQDQAYQHSLVYGAFIETVLHEIALAVFHTLQVPVWGRESDAADRLAALIMTQFGEDVMATTIETTAQIFQWSNKAWSGKDFAATDSPEAQRFYNYLCVAYAAAPFKFSYLVRGGMLPSTRADRCDGEYQQIKKAFNLRIMPYVDADLLVKARARRWPMPALGQGGNG
jgi:hypothetical protein